MDHFIKQDETGDLIETGMNVANHFLSAPIQGTNLLSKATIIPGVAPVLIGNPEQKNIQYPTASHQGSKSKGRSSGAKPIIVSSSEVGTGGTQIPEPLFAQTGQGGTVTTVYQDPTIQPTGSYRSVELAKIGKERMINRFVEKPRTSTPVTEFKRGAGSGCSRPDNPRGGHRREWSLSWVQGEVRVFEWCNPICSPITAAARFHSCKCGNCPAKCDQCERDYGPP
uniref:Non-structural protein V n=1 Tax=Mumps virus genotype G TaxID=1384672 RepID=A0A2D1Q813_MUMPV|nr:V protein [Mumps virus genotype G]